MYFPAAKLDSFSKMATYFVVVMLFMVTVTSFALVLAIRNTNVPGSEFMFIEMLAVLILLLVFLGYFFLMQPRGYEIEGDSLVVVRRWIFRFPKIFVHDIQAIGKLDKWGITSGAGIRLFGNGGLFGYSGWFWRPKLGKYVVHATNRNNMIAVKDRKRLHLISPENPQATLDYLQSITNLKAIEGIF